MFSTGFPQFAPWLVIPVGFFSVLIADIVWVLYIRWCAQGRAVRAGILSSLLVFNGWMGILVLLGNPTYAIPAEMAGAFIGTTLAIRMDRKKVA
jgi:hypothetical protein